MFKLSSLVLLGCVWVFAVLLYSPAFSQTTRKLAGTVVTPQFEYVPGVNIEVAAGDQKLKTVSDGEGRFSLLVPNGEIAVTFSGKNIPPVTLNFATADNVSDIRAKVTYSVPPISESVTIQADALEPSVESRTDTIYKNSLFGRDDQLIFTLNAGINAGQHEGGGKSLEIRRFGYNLDHGGVNGGLKILVDNFQQNQTTQGHGQGYLGNLKSLSPELVEDVSIINGPFSAAYGDFSGLGVVQIRQKESLPQQFTARIQGGAFNTIRGFFAYSPNWKNIDAFVSYEPSYIDGPFINRGRYRRDNVTGNFTYKLNKHEAFGAKFNFGRNNFYSSGQIPLDEVNAGRLDRFGFIDPSDGGRVRLGNAVGYYRREWASGATFKADAFIARSLFDLFSNFTFFLSDPIYGDEIQQHDSRLQEGGNVQYLRPYKFLGNQSLLTIGGNIHLNQINVGLFPTIDRDPSRKSRPENIDNPDVPMTSAHAKVNNYAGYIQNMTDFFQGHLRIEAGLRFDYFGFRVNGYELGGRDTPGLCNSDFTNPVNPANPCSRILNGKDGAGKFQPKFAVAVSPFERQPISFYINYGRGISSQDARGIVRNPDAPKIATTDFYQAGTSYNSNRVSVVGSFFFIDRSNEQVYIPDDGSLEFKGRSCSYGFEIRNSMRFNRHLSLNAGLTQVIRAYFPGRFTNDGRRIVVDSAPHTAANGALVLSELGGFNGSLSWRHIGNYRLDGSDPAIKAAGLDVVDLSLTKRLRKWVDLNFSVDNLFNKRFFETQNFIASRISRSAPVVSQIHATPGYPLGVYAGLTFRFGAKN
jgi:TonB dependent receptor/TonB-dependent Receptor Plug Domain